MNNVLLECFLSAVFFLMERQDTGRELITTDIFIVNYLFDQ